MKNLIFTLVILLAGIGLAGQEATEEKPKRWQLTSHLGLNGDVVTVSSNGLKGSNLFISELAYRLHRHLDVGVQLGHQRENWTGFSSILLDVFQSGSFRTSWNSRRSNYFIGLHAKLNYRIGQGDLSLSSSYGMNRHHNLVEARNPLPFHARAKMAPVTNTYYNVQIGYTYWATPRFGLMVGYSFISLTQGRITRNVVYPSGSVPRYIIKEVEVQGAELSEFGLSNLVDQIDSSAKRYFTLGLTTRIF